MPDSLEVRHLEENSNQDDNNVRLPPVKTSKEPRRAATNGKSVNNKLSLALTKLVWDKLSLGFPKGRSLEDNSDQDDDNIKLLPKKAGKWPKIAAANEKLVNGKLLLILTKLALKIGQDVRAKKILTLKTS